jgi:choline dehydrogenase-like flavoprotein
VNEPDVCVVGSGAGGAVAAWALVKRGVRVLLLETGPRFEPAHFGTHDPSRELTAPPLAAVAQDPARRSYASAPGQPLDPAFAHLTTRTPTVFCDPVAPVRRPFVYSRALGVGGSTLHYQGEAHRFPAHAFRMRSERGVAADWPVSYQELVPYYERIEQLLGVAGDPGNPFKPARGPFPYRAHPLSAASLRIGEAARKLGWQHLPNSLAALPKPRPGRAACHYCNGCSRGCAVGARGSVDVAVIPEAEKTGLLALRTDFHVARLYLDARGRVAGVMGFGRDGGEERISAAAVVLAAGAVETPRLLLNSSSATHPDGVGNANDQVGRHFMEMLNLELTALLEPGLESWAGLPLDSRIWDFNGAAGQAETPAGYVLGQVAGDLEAPAGFAWEGAAGFGTAHREAMMRFGGGLQLIGVAEHLPRADNRVTLAHAVDRHGLPLASVESHLDRSDLETLRAMDTRLRTLADAAGADVVANRSAYDVPLATHVAGGCRMGVEPGNSVVDALGTVHGHPNLVVADASVLVTQGAGDSPSLTIQALALRAAEALVQRSASLG